MNEQSMRKELLNRLGEIELSMVQVKSEAGVVELDQTANGRLTRMDAMQQAAMSSARLVRLQNDVRKYQAALARLDAGEYGICCRCGDEIALARLQHDPAAPFCMNCVEGDVV